jgi:hypothetical protein
LAGERPCLRKACSSARAEILNAELALRKSSLRQQFDMIGPVRESSTPTVERLQKAPKSAIQGNDVSVPVNAKKQHLCQSLPQVQFTNDRLYHDIFCMVQLETTGVRMACSTPYSQSCLRPYFALATTMLVPVGSWLLQRSVRRVRDQR